MENNETEPKMPVTPIKRAAKYQKDAEIKTGEIDTKSPSLKMFDIILNGREFQLTYDRETGNIILDVPCRIQISMYNISFSKL